MARNALIIFQIIATTEIRLLCHRSASKIFSKRMAQRRYDFAFNIIIFSLQHLSEKKNNQQMELCSICVSVCFACYCVADFVVQCLIVMHGQFCLHSLRGNLHLSTERRMKQQIKNIATVHYTCQLNKGFGAFNTHFLLTIKAKCKVCW